MIQLRLDTNTVFREFTKCIGTSSYLYIGVHDGISVVWRGWLSLLRNKIALWAWSLSISFHISQAETAMIKLSTRAISTKWSKSVPRVVWQNSPYELGYICVGVHVWVCARAHYDIITSSYCNVWFPPSFPLSSWFGQRHSMAWKNIYTNKFALQGIQVDGEPGESKGGP